jgi:hypothetical protein
MGMRYPGDSELGCDDPLPQRAFSEGRENGIRFRSGLPCPDEALPG